MERIGEPKTNRRGWRRFTVSELHSIVCVKVTPKPEEIRVDPETHLLVRAGARSEINPPDMNALELALMGIVAGER